MRPTPEDYLYALATVTVTFVGFSALFVTVRQALGGTVAKYDILLVRNVVYQGLIVILGALLPPLLALLGAQTGLVTRGASALTALPIAVYNATYPSRRHAATGTAMPTKAWLDFTLIWIAAAVLLANAVGAPIKSGIAPHALGLTILLVATFLAFVFGLDLLPTEPARPVRNGVEPTDGGPRQGSV